MQNKPTWLPVVALALRDDAGRYLMHRRPETKRHGGLWEFPGGKVESGETPACALVREIAEEVGIGISTVDLTPVAFAQEVPREGEVQIVILLYTCTVWEGRPMSLEGGGVGWFLPNDIERLKMPPLDVALCRRLFASQPD